MEMPLNIDWQQILLHLLNFVLLFAILYFLLYSPIKKFMDKRIEYYKNLDDEAKANLAESEKNKEEYLSRLTQAQREADEMKEKASREMEECYSTKITEAENEAKKIIAQARANAEKERSKIMQEARDEVLEMAASAAQKLMINSTTSDAYDSFLNMVKRSGTDEE